MIELTQNSFGDENVDLADVAWLMGLARPAWPHAFPIQLLNKVITFNPGELGAMDASSGSTPASRQNFRCATSWSIKPSWQWGPAPWALAPYMTPDVTNGQPAGPRGTASRHGCFICPGVLHVGCISCTESHHQSVAPAVAITTNDGNVTNAREGRFDNHHIRQGLTLLTLLETKS